MSKVRTGERFNICLLMAFPPQGSQPIMMPRNALINAVITTTSCLGNKAAADFSRHELDRQLKEFCIGHMRSL